MRTCPNGHEVSGAARFCSACGEAVAAPVEDAAPVVAAAPLAKKGGLPGWAIALIVVGVFIVIVLPVVIIAAVVFLGNEASQTFSVTSSELFPY